MAKKGIDGPSANDDLPAHRQVNVPNCLYRAVVHYVMQAHVLFQLNYTTLEFILSFEIENTQKSIYTHEALMLLIDNRPKGKCKFWKHFKLCMIIELVLPKCKDSLSDETCQKIFNFILKLIEQHEDKKVILEAFCVLQSFPFEKYQCCLLKLINLIEKRLNGELMEWDGTLELESVQMPLIDLVENQLNVDNYNLHRNLCVVIREVLCKFKDSLSDQICARMFNYLVKLIDLCDHEETFNFAGNVLREFPFDKYPPLLGRLVISMESQLNSNICYRVEKLWIFQEILVEWEDMFTMQIREQMFNYLVMLICERSDGIDVLKYFPFHRELTVVELWDSAIKHLKDKKCNWDQHWKLCSVIQEAFWRSEHFFRGEEYKLSKQTYRLMFDYILELIDQCDNRKANDCAWDAMEQFSFHKHSQLVKFIYFAEYFTEQNKTNGIHFQLSLEQLCDSAAKQLKNEQCDWDNHWILCTVIQQAFERCFLSQQTCVSMFDYLIRLIDQCDHEKTNDCAWDALQQFPFDKYHSQLVELVNFVENRQCTEQNNNDIHSKLCAMLVEVIYQHSLSQQTCDEILDYLLKHVGRYSYIYDRAWCVLKSFSYFSIERCIISLNKQLKQEPNRCDIHLALCMIIQEVYSRRHDNMLRSKFNCRSDAKQVVFDYLRKLINQFEDEKTNDVVWAALRKLSIEKFQFILINLIENELCIMSEHCKISEIDIYWKTSKTIEKLFGSCYGKFSWITLRQMPFEKFESVLLHLIDLFEDELNRKSFIRSYSYVLHRSLCVVIREVLCRFKDSLSDQICARMFDYFISFSKQRNPKMIIFAGNVLWKFSFKKYQPILRRLANSFENNKNWWKMVKLYSFQEVLMNLDESCKFYSLVELINSSLIGRMKYYALRHFPFNLAAKQLKDELCDWNSHWELLTVIKKVLSRYRYKIFSPKTCDQILDYIVKLLELCDHMETVDIAWTILEQFPLKKYQSILTQLMENQLNGNLDFRFKRHKKLCEALEKELTYGDSLNQQIFEYLTKLIVECKKSVQSASEQVPINKKNPLMQLIDSYQSIVKQSELMPNRELREVLKVMFNRLKDLYNQLASDRMVEYLKHTLKNQLFEHLHNSQSQYSHLHDLRNDFDFVKYRKESCAHMESINEPVPAIKLSPDRFGAMTMARKDRDGFAPVRSPFYVTSGIYFYEVILVTGGKMQFGWSTCEVRFDRWEDGDECAMWVCFDVKGKCVRHNGKQWNFHNRTECREGDVVGCLIDFDERRFVFYYNGQTIECSSQIYFSTLPYYATARLSLNQQCYFNLGQAPFMFAPDDIPLSNFIKESESDIKRCQLIETGMCNSFYSDYWMYWFKHSTMDNRVDVTFSDPTQEEIDEMVRFLGGKIREGRKIDEEWREFMIIKEIETDSRWRTLRLIQSIIEVMVRGDKVDVMAMWIGRIIEDEIDQVWCEKILELINPYLELRVNFSKDLTKHRNICIVLIHLIMFSQTWYRDFLDDIHSEVFIYLTRTLADTTDLWTQLFAIIALTNLKLTEGEKRLFRKNDKISQILNFLKDNIKCKNIGEFLAFKNHAPILIQLHFACEHFLNLNFNPSIVIQPNPVALNPNDRTKHLKLSPDQLTTRSDWKWQSVRSFCCVEKGICFFEAVLLTNGPMRVGWSTQRTDLEKTEIGGDQFSIAFDGYNRCVWHNDLKLYLETRLQPWKARDVIGCLIEVTKENNQKVRQFSFYLNGQLISYKSVVPIYSSTQPYHASISLESHQQVWFNFGQANFKFAPLKDYLSFYHYAHHKLINYQAPINLHNVINSLILLNSNNTITGNVAMNYRAEMIENILREGLTLECITCPVCHRKILLNHFFTDCCRCLKLSMDKPTENELPSITSAEESKSNTPELTVATVSAANLGIVCKLCEKIKQTRPLQFVGCDHMQLCRDCVPNVLDCCKCKANITPTSKIR